MRKTCGTCTYYSETQHCCQRQAPEARGAVSAVASAVWLKVEGGDSCGEWRGAPSEVCCGTCIYGWERENDQGRFRCQLFPPLADIVMKTDSCKWWDRNPSAGCS
jgi:hypothetical protein